MAKTKTKVAKDAEEIGSSKELYNFLYEACNILRGPVSQDAFKEYITPLLYFKRISDVYDEETKAALELSDGDEEFAALPEQHRFVIPEGCHWDDVRQRTSDIGSAIIGAMRQIELANPMTLYGLPSNASFTETELERAIIHHLKDFLLEMGKGFAFVAEQRHIRTEQNDYFIDLVFYNRRRDMAYFNEDNVTEQMCIDVAKETGYTVVNGKLINENL